MTAEKEKLQTEPENKVQLLFTENSITVNVSLFKGVLVSETFYGSDCYLKMIDLLKKSFPPGDEQQTDNNTILVHATIIVQ